jgi:hypothetical protein
VSAAVGRTLVSLNVAALSASIDTPTEWNYRTLREERRLRVSEKGC